MWNNPLGNLTLDPYHPPSQFTWFLIEAGLKALKQRRKCGKRTERVAELGAKEGLVSLYFSRLVYEIVATEIDEQRLNLIQQNIKHHKVRNIDVHKSYIGCWLPIELDWQEFDMFLINPPSIPQPLALQQKSYKRDQDVLFAGPDGRSEVRKILNQLAVSLGRQAEAVIVGADYVLDSWLQTECSRLNLNAQEIARRRIPSYPGEIDWELRNYIRDKMGWYKLEIIDGAIYFDQVAYCVSLPSSVHLAQFRV